MSVVFVVVPAVVVGWPAMTAAIASAAAALGYRALQSENEQIIVNDSEPLSNSIEMPLEGSNIVAEAMQRESQFMVHRGDVTATFSRAADGRCLVHVSGQGKTDQELQQVGQELVGRVTQHYAYNKVLSELKNQGFTVTDEEVANDQTIRIQVSKYV